MAGISYTQDLFAAKLEGPLKFQASYNVATQGKHGAATRRGDKFLAEPDQIVVTPGTFSASARVTCDVAHEAMKGAKFTVGFVQNLMTTNRLAEWDFANKSKVLPLPTPPTPGLDQAAGMTGPWYNSDAFKSLSTESREVKVTMIDAPKWSIVTRCSMGDLVRLSGEDQFHVWLVAFREPLTITQPIYLGFACWEIEYIDVPVFSGTARTRDKMMKGADGKPQYLLRLRLTASGQGPGRALPVLSGATVNSDFSNQTGVYDPDK